MYTRLSWQLLTGIFVVSLCTLQAQEIKGPQAKLPITLLSVGDKKFTAEVADDDTERETGMMFRKSMPEGESMLFVLGPPQGVAFWMKNTLLPLSVAYIDPAGTIMEIHDLKPQDETPIASKFNTISYAIEVPQGWFLKSGILPGAHVEGLPPLPQR